MKRIVRAALALLLLVCAGWAQAQSCSLSSGSANAVVTDIFGGNTDVAGSVTFSCTRPSGAANRFPATFWIGISGSNGSRTMSNGANTLGYYLFTNYSACSTAWQTTTGLTYANTLTGNTNTSVTFTVPFCLRIYSGQTTAKPLAYTGAALTLTVRSTNSTGFSWGTASGAPTATVNARCYFSTSPSTVSMNYTSFQAATATGSGSFQMRCTNTTTYSLALDAVTGSVLGLTYGVGLGTVGTGSVTGQVGTGNAQTFTVAANIASGQAGTCNLSAGCSGTSTRTITATY